MARIQLRAALYSFAHIFPDSVPKPTRSKLEQDWAALLAGSETAIRVALLGEVVVGVVAYGADPALTPPGYGHLARLYVDPDHAGQGIGGALHDLALVGLAAAGWSRGWLWVLEGNSRARGMYEKRGWEARHARRTDWPGSGVFEMSYARLL